MISLRHSIMAAAVLIASAAAVSCEKYADLLYGTDKDKGKTEESETSIVPRSTYLSAEESSVWVDVTAKGDWLITLEFADAEGGWATIAPETGTGKRSDVRLKVQANTGEDSRTVKLNLQTEGGQTASVSVEQQGAGGSSQGQTGSYGYDVAPSSLDWLELPAMVAGDGRELLIHDFEGGKYKNRSVSGVRNWSCYWDYDDHESLWVAYPLNNSLKGSGSRSNMWGYDALLPTSIQPDITGGSYGGGWTRGHQIPSADRLTTTAANASTFVPTNMTPQDYDFNSKIWAGLEGYVRDYAAKADTLYVVTGALFDGSSRYSGNSTGFAVKIPTHYFKALLYKGSSTYATNGYMMAGFILPHDTSISGGNSKEYICTIDELEEQTGIDFFPNLALKIGKEAADRLEAEAPAYFWK